MSAFGNQQGWYSPFRGVGDGDKLAKEGTHSVCTVLSPKPPSRSMKPGGHMARTWKLQTVLLKAS